MLRVYVYFGAMVYTRQAGFTRGHRTLFLLKRDVIKTSCPTSNKMAAPVALLNAKFK